MHRTNTPPLALGIIGIQDANLFRDGFNTIAIPTYTDPIRLRQSIHTFDTKSYSAYSKAYPTNPQHLQFIDSLAPEQKPKFLTLELVDQVAITSALKATENNDTKTYIQHQKKAQLVKAVSIVFPQTVVNDIRMAEALYLTTNSQKQYGLSLVNAGKPYKTIDFSQGTVFAYTVSNFCWGEDEKRKTDIFTLVDEADSCPKRTYRDAGKAKKEFEF
ncbi:hypothetical protein ACE939_11025 [Aquimarina sp. W85]|uniref:hypothetical protein n=1 Tax=Aquimarina rhodophyticola TaxID=3342246 RepID=UPI00366F3B09